MQIPPKARAAVIAIAAMFCVRPVQADMSPRPLVAGTSDDISCEASGAAAEQAWNLPAGLLTSIGRIEAGRYDQLSGRVVAWPWTINALGQGRYFDSKAAAIAGVLDLQMRGIQSIDIGCFQVNLMFHPDAFASLEDAFDAASNARAAARFLSELHDRSGSWETAVAWYHSTTPGLGEPYRDQVLADWKGGELHTLPRANFKPPNRARRGGTSNGAALNGSDPFVVVIAAHTTGVAVWRPAWASNLRAGSSSVSTMRRASTPFGRLPRIITPQG
jgi:hypothetical protein